jgi:hypothetical protein
MRMRAGSLAISWDARFIIFAKLGATYFGLGIEVGEAGDLDELFLRLLEARNGIALPCFRLSLSAFLSVSRSGRRVCSRYSRLRRKFSCQFLE